MIVLQGKKLEKYYITDLIFKDVDFYIQEGEKVGLVGPNGAGKTTLFRCITGEEAFDSGQLQKSAKHTMGYLEQMPDFQPKITLLDAILEMFADIFALRDQIRQTEQWMGEVGEDQLAQVLDTYAQLTHQYEEMGGFSVESKAKGIAKGLGFREDDFSREICHFSGGEKQRVLLARLLVREPDILLLDEPTNHLDLEALEWLEGFLRNYKGAIFMISHDRYFLDQIAEKIVEMNHHGVKSYTGNYTRYLQLKTEQELAQMRAYEKQQEEIAKTEEYIRKYKAGIKSKQARGRQSRLNRMQRLENVKTNKTMALNFGEVDISGDIVLNVDDLSMKYGEKTLFQHIGFTIYKGEKVGLIGGNGVGKSTILNIIVGEAKAINGTIRLGSRVKVSYYNQEHRQLNPNNTILNEIVYQYDLTLNEARDLLAQVLFFGEDVEKYIRDLSGGERARLALLKILIEKPNFLIMDEPTNHLDIASKDIVEDFLFDFPGTILLVSHDRYLLDSICDRTLSLEEGKITAYLGNYSYYKQKKAELERIQKEREEELALQKKTAAKVNAQPKKNKSKIKEQIAEIEEEIAAKELRLNQLSDALADHTNYSNEESAKSLVQEYKMLEKEIPVLYEKWEALSEELES